MSINKKLVKEVSIHEAKTHLSRLLNELVDSGEILITKSGRPVAKILPFETKKTRPQGGLDKGKIIIHDSFFEELSDDVLNEFYK